MEREPQPQFEDIVRTVGIPPTSESFFHPEHAAMVWPEEVIEHPAFIEQTTNQRHLRDDFEKIISNTETSPAEKVAWYTHCAKFFSAEGWNQRLVLYLPFQLLAAPTETDESVQAAYRHFTDEYLTAWYQLLSVRDVRANFVDGDVPEMELRNGDLPRVVKAAHLLPELLTHHILHEHDVLDILHRATDPVLIASIVETLPVLRARNLLSMAAMDEIESLPHPNITDTLYTPLDTSIPSPLTAEAIAQELTASVQAAREINPEKSVPARTAWLQSDARRKAITTASKKYADRIISGDVTPETLFSETTPEQLCAEIEAVRIATLANPDLYTVFHMQIENLYTTHPSGEIHERCATYLYHLTTAGIADTDTLTKLGLALPHLAGPFSKNLEQVTPLLDEITAMCDILETDPFLRTRVLPVTLVFGSQVKGYGTASADADVAIFVRPGTPRNERTQIETELATVFAHEKIGGKAVMFWLEATPERQLVIQDFTEPAHSDGASTFTHVLFGASWQGDTNTIEELHAKLLTNYFQHPDTKTEGAPTRQRWLEEQERDTLQYRLMHKGFARYHAVQSPYANAPLMDGNTAFYDETYRTTATKLFLEHVFLPDLNRPVKTGT